MAAAAQPTMDSGVAWSGGSARTSCANWAIPSGGWRQKHGRRTRPWIPEPGLWVQWDYGEGPIIGSVRTVLFCAWLAWSRYRVVVPLRDKTLPSVLALIIRHFEPEARPEGLEFGLVFESHPARHGHLDSTPVCLGHDPGRG